jgi:hypothetical protein
MAWLGVEPSLSPQRAHAGPLGTGNSVQQTGQIGVAERRGRLEPQRAHEAGRRAQLKLSRGLRSTRTTARHLVVSDGGTVIELAPVFLWKTHLASGRCRRNAARCAQYSAKRNPGSSRPRRDVPRMRTGSCEDGFFALPARVAICSRFSGLLRFLLRALAGSARF